jgi:voltage-gated potassium channel
LKLENYQAKALWPMTVLAVFFLVAFIIESFRLPIAVANPGLFGTINLGLWLIFVADYLFMLYLAENKKEFFHSHYLDLALVAFPFLRPLRALRLLVLFERAFSGMQQKLYVNIPVYVAGAASLLVLMGGATLYSVEVDAVDTNIKSPQDALWWAAVTVTTVGYGDKYPVTGQGRLVAVGLMITGIAVVGTVTASLAAWIVEKVNAEK